MGGGPQRVGQEERAMLESKRFRRAVGVLAGVAMMLGLAVVTPVGAQDTDQALPRWLVNNPIPEDQPFEVLEVRPNGRVLVSGPLGRVYGSAGDGYALIGTDDMLQVCLDPVASPEEFIVYRSNGTFVSRTGSQGIPIRAYLYETDLAVFDYFDEVCTAFHEEGTPIPAPFASSIATLKAFERPSQPIWNGVEQPPGIYRNSIAGVFADVDGNLFDVEGVARFEILEGVEGPPNFEQLTLEVTPTAG